MTETSSVEGTGDPRCEISNPARGSGLDRANPDRGAQRRSGCSPVQPKSEGLDWCSHMPQENRFERFSQLLHFVWLSDGKVFFLTSAKCMVVVQQDSRLRWCWEPGSSPAVDLRCCWVSDSCTIGLPADLTAQNYSVCRSVHFFFLSLH